MSENGADGEMADAPTGPLPAQPAAGRDPRPPAGSPSRMSFPEIEVKVPEVAIPEPTGRTEFSESPFAESARVSEPEPEAAPEPAPAEPAAPAEKTEYHDVWGKVEAPHLHTPKPRPAAPQPDPQDAPQHEQHEQHEPRETPEPEAWRPEPEPAVADEPLPPAQGVPTVEAKTGATRPPTAQDLADVVGPVEFDVDPGERPGPPGSHGTSGAWWHDEPREPVPAWDEPKPSAHQAPSVDALHEPSAYDAGFAADTPAAHGMDAPARDASAYDSGVREPGAHDASGKAADDVKVAPKDEQVAGPGWEGSLFEDDAGPAEGDGRYAAVADPTMSSGTARPGRPSSGNWQMPGWMADEKSADGMLIGGDGGEQRRSGGFDDGGGEGGGRSRVALFGGVGLLVIALVAAGGVYFMKTKKDGSGSTDTAEPRPSHPAAVHPTGQPEPPKAQLPPDKPLAKFAGKPGKIAGRATDAKAGLSYPRFAEPWQAPTKKNKLAVPGWSGQQILVTEKHGDRLWYGQLLTGTLLPALQSHYKGPESLREVTALAVKGFDKQYYAFDHDSSPLASQEITVGPHKGWLIANYLKYKRPGVKATGEVVVTAVIDTGHKTPAVVFASMPNTERKLWPDLNAFLDGLKVAS